MNKDIPEVKIIKKNISNILTNHLFINAINKKELQLEHFGFVKLL